MRRAVAAVAVTLAFVAHALGASGCGSADNGGVIEPPTTTTEAPYRY